jgi:hypothetical protein
MLIEIGSVDNAITMPSPVLDDSTQGYHIEERLQVTLKSPANDKTSTIEFRLGPDSDAPAMDLLIQWMESGELVRVLCSGVTARPFVHQEGKQYRSRGSQKEINGQQLTMDAMVMFAGLSAAPVTAQLDLEEEIRRARGQFKKQQRGYREQLNARRRTELEATLPERVAKMREARAKQDADTTQPAAEASARKR